MNFFDDFTKQIEERVDPLRDGESAYLPGGIAVVAVDVLKKMLAEQGYKVLRPVKQGDLVAAVCVIEEKHAIDCGPGDRGRVYVEIES